jgi:hypothetical protein
VGTEQRQSVEMAELEQRHQLPGLASPMLAAAAAVFTPAGLVVGLEALVVEAQELFLAQLETQERPTLEAVLEVLEVRVIRRVQMAVLV